MSDQPPADAATGDAASTAPSVPTTIDPTQTQVAFEHTFDRPLTACCWDPLDRFVVVGSEDYGVQRFNLANQQITPLIGPHDSWVRAIGFTPDGQTLISGGYDGRLIWWPAAADKPEPLRVVDAHTGWIRGLAVDPGGRYVASCGNDLNVRLWDAQTGELLQTCSGHQSHVYNVAFAPHQSSLASCDLKGVVKVWDLSPLDHAATNSESANGPAETLIAARELPPIAPLHKYDTSFRADIGGARCMRVSHNGERLALGGITNVTNAFAGIGEVAVAIVNLSSGELETLLVAKEKIRGTAWGVAEHADGFWIGLAGGGSGGWLYFWRLDTAEEFFKLKLKSDARGMSLSTTGAQIAVAHADRTLQIYNLHAPTS